MSGPIYPDPSAPDPSAPDPSAVEGLQKHLHFLHGAFCSFVDIHIAEIHIADRNIAKPPSCTYLTKTNLT
jgi:hypothetical protein